MLGMRLGVCRFNLSGTKSHEYGVCEFCKLSPLADCDYKASGYRVGLVPEGTSKAWWVGWSGVGSGVYVKNLYKTFENVVISMCLVGFRNFDLDSSGRFLYNISRGEAPSKFLKEGWK